MPTVHAIHKLLNAFDNHQEINPGELDEHGFPSDFYCPISRELFEDPVITLNGFVYERKEIQKWIDERRNLGLSLVDPSDNYRLLNEPNNLIVPLASYHPRLLQRIKKLKMERTNICGKMWLTLPNAKSLQIFQGFLWAGIVGLPIYSAYQSSGKTFRVEFI